MKSKLVPGDLVRFRVWSRWVEDKVPQWDKIPNSNGIVFMDARKTRLFAPGDIALLLSDETNQLDSVNIRKILYRDTVYTMVDSYSCDLSFYFRDATKVN